MYTKSHEHAGVNKKIRKKQTTKVTEPQSSLCRVEALEAPAKRSLAMTSKPCKSFAPTSRQSFSNSPSSTSHFTSITTSLNGPETPTKVLNLQSIAQIRGTTSEDARYLFGEGVKEAVEEQPGGVADVPVVAAHPLGGVSGGTEARGLRGSSEEAGRGGRAGEAAPGGRREGVVPEVVPAKPPGATGRQEERDPAGA